MDNAEPDNEYVIDTYGKKLFSMYPDRCLKVLANAADRQARTSKNRRDYKYIARTLKKMVAHPGGRLRLNWQSSIERSIPEDLR